MENSIFLLSNEGQLSEMTEQSYDAEDQLQELLALYPKLIPGAQINTDSPRRWLLISREIGVPDKEKGSSRWSLDHLFLDQEGVPTLVEVKRSSDTRIRREVIGQMLDYAANAVTYWSIEEITNRFAKSCGERGEEPSLILSEFLEDGRNETEFWESVHTNLRAGKIRLILVADVIPKEMIRIIEFLNGQMSPAEILGVEIRQFTGRESKTLVPKVVGFTANAQTMKTAQIGEYRKWDEQSFFDELSKNISPGEVAVARKLYQWAIPRMTRVWFGEGKTMGSFVPILNVGKDHQLFVVWTTGLVEFYFSVYKLKQPFNSEEKRLELLKRLNQIPGMNLAQEKITKQPKFPLSILINNNAFDLFIQTFEWFCEEVKNTN